MGKPQWEQDLRLAHPELSQHRLRPLSLAYESAFRRANGQGPKHNDGADFCSTRPVNERFGLTANERKAAKYSAGRVHIRLTAIGKVIDKTETRVTRARNRPIFKKTDSNLAEDWLPEVEVGLWTPHPFGGRGAAADKPPRGGADTMHDGGLPHDDAG